MVTLVQDSFSRTVESGWGQADTGQTWVTIDTDAGLSVDGASAVGEHTSGKRNIAATLDMTPAVDLDVTIAWRFDQVPSGGVAGPRLYARYIDGVGDYHARILAAADSGAITVGLYRGDAAIITAPVATGATLGAGYVMSRVQAIGSSPTVIKAKVWSAGDIEPEWQVTGTDSDSAMQAPGTSGLRFGLAGGTVVPITSRLDSVLVTDGASDDPTTGNVGAHFATSPAHNSITAGVSIPGGGDLDAVLHDASLAELDRVTVALDSAGWGHATFPGLTPSTEYVVTFELGGVEQADALLSIKTLPAPGTPASFTVVAGSCQFTGSNHPSWDAILADAPIHLAHMGDLHYEDATVEQAWRAGVEASFTADRMAAVLESAPITWTWDNHDRIITDDGGPGAPLNSGTTDPATNTLWRQLAGVDGWASPDTAGRTFVIGRVRFIQTDNWTARDDPDASGAPPLSFLGSAQKQWFKDTLEAATEPIIVWLSQWTSATAASGRWNSYPDELAELEAFFNQRPELKSRMVMIGGDSHSLQVTDGSRTQGNFAGIPSYNISGFNRSSDTPHGGAGWTVDEALRTSAQPEGDWGGYSRITVTDDGTELVFKWEGVRVNGSGNTDVMATQVITAATPANPQPWDAVYIGPELAAAVYVGAERVWP